MKAETKTSKKLIGLKWSKLAAGKVCGVYMLMRGKKILYIGASVNIAARLMAHRTEGRIRFTDVRITKVSPSKLASVEKALIKKHQPKYNYVNTERQKKGLPVDDRRVVSFNLPRLTVWKMAEMAEADSRSMTQWLRLKIDVIYDAWWRDQHRHDIPIFPDLLQRTSPQPPAAQPEAQTEQTAA